MADFENDSKASNKYKGNESLHDRHSFSRSSGNHGLASACTLQPVRVKALLDMDESDDDDSEDKDRSSDDDDEAASSDSEDAQPLPLDDENVNPKEMIKLPNIDSLYLQANISNEPKMEIITEESERLSISRELIKNPANYVTPTTTYSPTTNTTISTMTMPATTIPTTFSHQLYDKSQQTPGYSLDKRRSSVSKESFHDERMSSINRFSTTGFTSDFGEMDMDSIVKRTIGNSSDAAISFMPSSSASSTVAPTLSKSQTVDLIGQKAEAHISTNTAYTNRQQSNMKLDVPDVIHPPHDRHIPTLTNYKVESASALSSKYDTPITTAQSDILSSSSIYPSANTPHKHNPMVGSMRPTPSVGHKNIYQTPQNKLHNDYSLNRSHAPTPGTIFSHWSRNNMITPMQNRSSESTQSPGKSNISKHDVMWYKNKETKGVRKPLAETTGSEHRVLNEKPSHGLKFQDPGENSGRSTVDNTSEKSAKSSIMIPECKENRRPLPILENVAKRDALVRNRISDSVQEIRHGNKDMIRKSVPPEIEPLREHYNNPSNLPNKPNVQASVPSRMQIPEHGKIMRVKDREYMILGYLGQGMSGEVVRVQDLTSFELRAIKCVDLSRMDKDSAQSCVQEITMLGKLQAPCVVQMFDYEIRNTSVYVVMEMGDTDLSKFLKSICAEKRLPLTMILYYWTEMLTAVKHIHDNGVIHSDLKPANFLLVRGRLKLIDFGIASSLNADMTSIVKNSTVGTLNYISPEALMDVGDSPNLKSKYKISYKSDVWSLGCILYSLVFGYTPFQHVRQQWAKINAITNPASKILFAQPPNSEPIPSILIDVVRKCLQHDPKARPSVAQLLEIRYVPIGKQSCIAPSIPSNILLKIKSALDDNEWRHFTEIMDQERKNC